MLASVLSSDNVSLSRFSESADCLEKLLTKPCDVLIVDLDKDEAGLQLLAQVHRTAPWILTVAIVPNGAVSGAVRAIKAGASECLEQPVQTDRLCAVVAGLLVRMASLPHAHRALTEMEIQIVQSILAGKTSQDIAANLCRSKRTIDVHRKNIMRKLQAGNLVDLVRQALAMGLGKEPRCKHAPQNDR
jgi:FixJ family two-component response regulator